jgi:DNA-binding phage protein
MQIGNKSTSKDYQDYLLSALSNPERIAKNIEVVLEEKERSSGLLRLTLTDIIQAKIKDNTLTEEAKLYFEKIDKILAQTDGEEIYTLVDLLSALGLKISIFKQKL